LIIEKDYSIKLYIKLSIYKIIKIIIIICNTK